MSSRTRVVVFGVAASGFAALLLWGFVGLPDFGHYRGPYGLILNRTVVSARHVTNVPTAVNFDYRAIDTLGEEFILLSGAVGLALTLRSRREREERPPETPDRGLEHTSEALRIAGLALVGPLLVLGFYILAHGHLSPGGGFQGGVILASALLLACLAGEFATLRRGRPWLVMEAAGGLGAAGYAFLGLAGLLGASAYFADLVPLGPMGKITSGGTIPIANAPVALEVTAAFLIVWSELLDQALLVRRRR